MKNKYFFRSMMVAMAILLMVTSCSKDEKEPELTPQQKAEAVIKNLKGANYEIKTNKIQTDIYDGKDYVQNEEVITSYSVEATTENGSPLITLYIAYSSISGPGGPPQSINKWETYIKFIPKVTAIDENRIKVSYEKITDVEDLGGGTSVFVKKEGNKLIDKSGTVQEFTNVAFEYNVQTKTINSLLFSYIATGSGFKFDTTYEYKNLPLDLTKEVVPFGESQYKSGSRD